MRTLAELRDNIADTVRDQQIDDLIDSFINITLQEVHNHAPWSWLRQKSTFSTVADQENYELDEEVGRINLIRQLDTPSKIFYIPDHIFYRLVPNPEDLSSATPRYYRLWEQTGFLDQPSSAEQLDIVSSSSSDTSQKVIIVGRESSNGLIISEEISLNGTTTQTTTNTFAASGLMQLSKSASTTGTITVTGNTSSTVFGRIAPEERAPKYRLLSFYPIPSSAITIYMEYLMRFRFLVNDADTPQLDHEFIWVIREGALSKTWEYKQKEALSLQHFQIYQRGLDNMKQRDAANLDWIPGLEAKDVRPFTQIRVRRTDDGLGHSVGYI